MLGIGTALPPHHIVQAQSAKTARQFVFGAEDSLRSLPALYRMTRVARRSSVLLQATAIDSVQQDFFPAANDAEYRGPSTHARMERFRQESPALAVQAARRALSGMGQTAIPSPSLQKRAAQQITHLITVSCTGFSAPGFDIDIIEQLGLSPEVQRVQIGFMGCHAIINALRVARALVAADPHHHVLIVSVELCSLHYQYGLDSDRLVANAIFADGCGAIVLAAPESELAGEINSSNQLSVTDTGSYLIPQSRDAMSWNIGDHGFEMTLAASVPNIVQEHLGEYLQSWLAQRGQSLSSIGGWAVHPGGPRVLNAVEEALQLPHDALEASRQVLKNHGNMSSATLVFILEEMRHRNMPGPWLMLGFGPGLEVEIALLN